MNKMIWALVLAFVLVACQTRGGQENAEAHKTTLQESLVITELETRVRDIYAAVCKVYNEEDSLSLVLPIEKKERLNTLYCSTEWNEAFNKVEEIHSLLNGWWERDYWIMGDGLGHNLSISDIKVVSMDEDKTVVEFQLHNSDSTQPVRVIMIQ